MSENLFGLPEAENLYSDPAAAYEQWVDDAYWDPDDPKTLHERLENLTIEEWTAVPASDFVPSSYWLMERCSDCVYDECNEGIADILRDVDADMEVRAAFTAARDLYAAKIGSRHQMADKMVATHIVTWDEDGEPLLDGEPMYRKAQP